MVAGNMTDDVYQMIIDFIETITTNVVMVIWDAGIEEIWDALVYIFVTMATTWGFLLMLCAFLYMFHKKYVADAI